MPVNSDPYLYPGTDVLRNIPDLRDPAQLAAFEANETTHRLALLGVNPIPGQFDAAHLKAIHHFIFQDVFPWADEFRTVNLAKGGHLFGLLAFVESALTKVLANLVREHYLNGLDPKAFSQRAGHYLGEINAIHPFREGNGRSQREFIRELGWRSGHRIRWTGITAQEMIEASRRSFLSADSTLFATLIERCL